MSLADSSLLNSHLVQTLSGTWTGTGVSVPSSVVFERIGGIVYISLASTAFFQFSAASTLTFVHSGAINVGLLPLDSFSIPINIISGNVTNPPTTTYIMLCSLFINSAGVIQILLQPPYVLAGKAQQAYASDGTSNFAINSVYGIPSQSAYYSLSV